MTPHCAQWLRVAGPHPHWRLTPSARTPVTINSSASSLRHPAIVPGSASGRTSRDSPSSQPNGSKPTSSSFSRHTHNFAFSRFEGRGRHASSVLATTRPRLSSPASSDPATGRHAARSTLHRAPHSSPIPITHNQQPITYNHIQPHENHHQGQRPPHRNPAAPPAPFLIREDPHGRQQQRQPAHRSPRQRPARHRRRQRLHQA